MKKIKNVNSKLFFFLLFSSVTGFSQTNSSVVKLINPSVVVAPKGYSHAAVIDLGNCKMIILSGEVPFDKNGNLIGKNDIEKQTEQVFFNIKNILSELGGSMDHVIKLGVYMKDVSQIQTFRNVRDRFINLKHPPTSTLAQVSKLFRDDVLIEIEATAIITK